MAERVRHESNSPNSLVGQRRNPGSEAGAGAGSRVTSARTVFQGLREHLSRK